MLKTSNTPLNRWHQCCGRYHSFWPGNVPSDMFVCLCATVNTWAHMSTKLCRPSLLVYRRAMFLLVYKNVKLVYTFYCSNNCAVLLHLLHRPVTFVPFFRQFIWQNLYNLYHQIHVKMSTARVFHTTGTTDGWLLTKHVYRGIIFSAWIKLTKTKAIEW